MKAKSLLTGLFLSSRSLLLAAPLTESTFTEVVKDVNIVAQATKAAQAAKTQDVVKAPDLVRTGPASRAELTAPDQTITRVGANTVFSFEPAGRDINLERGSLLFHSPSGKGGGTIKSGGAAAAVLGTTIIVVATPDGGFKVIVIEGKGRVTWPNGTFVLLNAGQLVFVLPGQSGPGRVLDINLAKLVDGSLLVNGFSHELPSLPQINAAIERQNRLIASGRAADTGQPADQFAGLPGNGLGALDNNTYQTAAHPPLTIPQIASLVQGSRSSQPPPGSPNDGPPPKQGPPAVIGPISGPGGLGIVVIAPK